MRLVKMKTQILKNKTRNIFLFSVALLLTGCFGFPTDWDVELWEQKIEGSNMSIYKFDAWGGRDSHVAGYKIKDSSKGFTQEDVLKSDGFSTLRGIPSNDLIMVINTIRPENEEPNSNVPVSNSQTKIEGISIDLETYRYNGTVSGNCTLKSYKFKTFEETRDSLIFYDNDSQFVNGKNYKRISVPKGNVYLMTTKDNKYVVRIVYSDLLVFDDLTLSKGIKICRHTKYFDTVDSVKVSDFTDYGIYKPVKQNKNYAQQ